MSRSCAPHVFAACFSVALMASSATAVNITFNWDPVMTHPNDADGGVDVSDFNIWNANKFMSAEATTPEPSFLVLFICAAIGLSSCSLRRRLS